MLTNKDIRVENGNIVINGDKYPLDGQSPEAIMAIVEDNSDTTPTENSTAPITSGGVFTALGTKQDTLTFDTTPTDESTNPVTSGGIYTAINTLANSKTDCFASSTKGVTQTINVGTVGNVNRIYLLTCGYPGTYVCGLILINNLGTTINFVKIVNNVLDVSSTAYNNGEISITFNNDPYTAAQCIRLC